MSEKQKPKQVSLAGAAAGKKREKKPVSAKRRWLILLLLVMVVAVLIVLFNRGCGSDGPSLSARETVQYTATPDDMASKVSYFALGVTGEKSTDRMDMVAVLCYDRKANKASLLQMPVATYLGESGDFAVTALGDVWGKPQNIRWCDTCRGRVKAQEVDGDQHAVCGSKLTTRSGSSFTNFIEVFNKQYGLPIDNYLVIPRNGLVKLIDAVGGVDIQLDSAISLEGIDYKKGVQTLTGKAAVYYTTQYGYKNTPQTDRVRMLRQRQLLAGLLDRLSSYSKKELYNTDPTLKDVLSNVILGADPIRYDTSSFGKSRLMGSSESKAEGTKYIAAMADFIYDLSHLKLSDITCSVLPGTVEKRGTGYVYSVNITQTIMLLNEQMNPYALTLDATTVTVPTLRENPAQADTATVTLDTVLAKKQTTE